VVGDRGPPQENQGTGSESKEFWGEKKRKFGARREIKG